MDTIKSLEDKFLEMGSWAEITLSPGESEVLGIALWDQFPVEDLLAGYER